MTDRAPRIFFSYSIDDQPFAAQIADLVRRSGGEVFVDDARPGEEWFESLKSQIEAADLVVFIVPAQEGQGRNALFEIGAAKALGKRILAILRERKRRTNADVAVGLADTVIMEAEHMSPDLLARTVVSAAVH